MEQLANRRLDLTHTTAKRPKRLREMLNHQARWAYLFMLPSLILFFLFTIIPILAAFFISFTNWDVITAPVYIGLQNY